MTTGWLQLDITYDEATNDYEVAPVFNEDEDQTRWFYFGSNGKKVKADDGDKVYAYQTLDDVEAFLDEISGKYSSGLSKENITALNSSRINVNKDADDLAELYIIDYDSDTSSYAFSSEDYFLVNTSGKVIDTNSKSKDGNDYVYVTKKNGSKPGQIVAIYVED